MQKLILITMLAAVVLIGAHTVFAQQDTQAPSAADIFVFVCENQAVVNFTGTMPTGYDVFYQMFSAAAGGGTAITSLRQVQVDGAYAFSETIPYNAGATIATGAVGSIRVIVGREGNPSSAIINTTVDDVQDGCNNPQHPVGTSIDLGTTDPVVSTSGSAGGGILSPFGGIINPPPAPAPVATPQSLVVIGPRTSGETGRSKTAGVIFAECNQFMEKANPGILYDTDTITIFWSWFASSPELVQEHIDNAGYAVALNNVALPTIDVSPIQSSGRDFWVFYTHNVGQLEPGSYRVDFNLVWGKPISDGYDEYGPDTETPVVNSNCDFVVQQNPFGLEVSDQYNRQFGPRPVGS